jgi:hypothetical protein
MGLSVRVGDPAEAPGDRSLVGTEEGIRAGYPTVPKRLKGDDGRGECRREAGVRVPGRGRSLIGAPHDFLRPGDSGPGPEGGPPNPLSGTALRSLSGLSINVSTFSSSDPTRHGREGNWACMREPIPRAITAERQREELGIIRAARSALGRRGDGEKAERDARRSRKRRGGDGGRGSDKRAQSLGGICAVRKEKGVSPGAFRLRVGMSESGSPPTRPSAKTLRLSSSGEGWTGLRPPREPGP